MKFQNHCARLLVPLVCTESIFIAGFGGFAAAQRPVPQPAAASTSRRMTVSGRGEVRAMPDKVDITAGTITEEKQASAASRANADAASKITAALLAAGVAEIDIQTVNFSVQPITASPVLGKPQTFEIISYRVTNDLHVTIRDTKKVGGILDAAMAGANYVQNITFGIVDSASLRERALELAVRDARRKADVLANAAGISIIGVYELNDNSVGGPVPMFAARSVDASSAQTPISPGQMSVTANVTVVYELGPVMKQNRPAAIIRGPIEKPQTIR